MIFPQEPTTLGIALRMVRYTLGDAVGDRGLAVVVRQDQAWDA